MRVIEFVLCEKVGGCRGGFFRSTLEDMCLQLPPCLLQKKNSAVCVRTPMVNVNTFSTTVKDEISEGW